ncbi:unnamed protein product [Periconia digitata]|uniref:Glycosylphosphatidylinositol anchor biosynthesis protein 11 n=1 Tax=Periconia digitata TaxID=1303443 RepID=A0A9W4UQW8_9PLEO|nr:unnamed protein product [Periconia digitata]
MSTTVIGGAPPKPRPPPTPISHLPTDSARLYTHIHPLLLLSLYTYQFPSIVADPVAGLAATLVPLAALQIAYVAVCLPPTGNGTGSGAGNGPASGGAGGEKRKIGEKKKANGSAGKSDGIGGRIIPAVLSVLLSLLVAAPLLTAALVLFGAPITTHHAHTLLCGAHIAFLAAIPLVYVHGVDGAAWRDAVALLLPVDEVYGGLLGAVCGAWLGAVPIPLDWDREWQKWPVTIVTGAYIGYVFGRLLGGTMLKGKKVMF